jgi:uncharacterized protein (TIGR04255 family)
MGTVITEPFGNDVPEVPLPYAPLAFVVAQVKFERVASISSEQFIAGFQEAIRTTYPRMRREQQASVLVGADGRLVTSESGVAWQFDEHPARWQVALTVDSIAISTSRYTSRTDFIDRFSTLLVAAHQWLNLRFCERLGVRYVDRVTDSGLLARIADLVRSEVVGAAAVSLGPAAVERVHSFSDSTYRLPDGASLHGRWGLLPAQVTLDPAIAPVDVPSWILDLDAYSTDSEPFDATVIAERAEAFCRLIYRFFRWTVTDEFISVHGGRL